MTKHLTLLLLFIGLVFAQDITIAVLEFEGKGVSQSDASILTDRLRNELFKIGSYNVLERAMMDDILKEQGFQQTGCATSECAVEVGNMLGVQQMIGGSIGKLGDMYTVSVRIIDVETGTVLNTANHDHIGGIEKLGMVGMKDVAIKLFGDSKDLADLEKRKASKDASCVALGVLALLVLLISSDSESDSEEETDSMFWDDW